MECYVLHKSPTNQADNCFSATAAETRTARNSGTGRKFINFITDINHGNTYL
jgi:hypothetical protein